MRERILRGGWATFLFFLLCSIVVLLALFATVHKRDSSKEVLEVFPGADRYPKAILIWINHGFFTHAGLRFQQPVQEAPAQELWHSSPMGFIQPLHLLERVAVATTGKFSYRLWVVHNQFVVALGAAVLALLAMRLAMRLGSDPFTALLFGLCCLIVFQTFPHNLFFYWEIYPSTFLALLAPLLLLVEESALAGEEVKLGRWRALLAFAIIYIEPFSGLFFLAAYVIITRFLTAGMRARAIVLHVLIPAAAGFGLYALQLLTVRLLHPAVRFSGSGYLKRTGLDGSQKYYRTHFDLLSRERVDGTTVINDWSVLFAFCVAALAILIVLYVRGRTELRVPVYVLTALLALYLPFAFLFSEAAVIHKYAYDVYLLPALLLAGFALLPAVLVRRYGHAAGLIVLLTLMTACGFGASQLRTYAVEFPLKSAEPGGPPPLREPKSAAAQPAQPGAGTAPPIQSADSLAFGPTLGTKINLYSGQPYGIGILGTADNNQHTAIYSDASYPPNRVGLGFLSGGAYRPALSADPAGNVAIAGTLDVAGHARIGADGTLSGSSLSLAAGMGTKISLYPNLPYGIGLLGAADNNQHTAIYSDASYPPNRVGLGFLRDGRYTPAISADPHGAVSVPGSLQIGSGASIRGILTANAAVDFGRLDAGQCQTVTVPLPGAAEGDVIALGLPAAAATDDAVYTMAWVSAADQVGLRRCNGGTKPSSDPPAAPVRISITRY